MNPETLVRHVCADMGVRRWRFFSRERSAYLTDVRSVAAYALREAMGLSYPEIARQVGRENHTTAINLVGRASRSPALQQRAAAVVAKVQRLLTAAVTA